MKIMRYYSNDNVDMVRKSLKEVKKYGVIFFRRRSSRGK